MDQYLAPIMKNIPGKIQYNFMINAQRDFILFADLFRKMDYENKK